MYLFNVNIRNFKYIKYIYPYKLFYVFNILFYNALDVFLCPF